MPRVTVRVTRMDIKTGEPFAPSRCPIARAVRRLCKPGVRPKVGYGCLEFAERGGPGVFPDIPDLARKFLLKFDNDEDVRRQLDPIRFTVRIPARFLKPTAPPNGRSRPKAG